MKNKKDFKSFLKGFLYAFRGIFRAIKEERNMRIHLSAALNVLVFAPFLDVKRSEYALILIAAALVLCLETVNSAIENLCDRITAEKDPLIGKVKDISAGSVLIAAIFSVAVGFAVLLKPEKIAALFVSLLSSPCYIAAFIFSEALLILFIIWPQVKKQKNTTDAKGTGKE